MDFNTYQKLARRTASRHPNALLNYTLGLIGEAGEVVELIKKQEFHGHIVNVGDIVKELGDVFWYVSEIASLFNIELNDVALENIEKLKDRYPQGFREEDSIHRSK